MGPGRAQQGDVGSLGCVCPALECSVCFILGAVRFVLVFSRVSVAPGLQDFPQHKQY